MTNSTNTRPGKRERLVAAAAELVQRHGIETPTLAQIAEAADVPPGNVYYYFRTREELLAALVDRRLEEVRMLLSALDHNRGPRARLKELAGAWAAKVDDLVEHGCSVGCLASELGKTHPHGRASGSRSHATRGAAARSLDRRALNLHAPKTPRA